MANRLPILETCVRSSQDFCESVLKDFYGALNDKLDNLLENSRSNLQQWQLMELQRNLKSNRTIFEQDYLQAFNNSFRHFERGDVKVSNTLQDTPQDTSSLSLVANDDLEQNIAAKTLIQRINGDHPEELCLLHERLCALINKKMPEEANPVGPTQLAQCLEAALQSLNLENQITILFFKVFEKVLHSQAGEFYQELNKTLSGANVLPNISFAEIQRSRVARPNPQSQAPQAPQEPEADSLPPQQEAPQGDPAHQQAANQPFSQQSASAQQQPINPNPESTAYQQELFGAIQQLQQAVFQNTVTGPNTAVNDPTNTAANRAVQATPQSGEPQPQAPFQAQTTSGGMHVTSAPSYSRSEVVSALNSLQSGAMNGNTAQHGNAALAVTQPMANFDNLAPGNLQICPVQPLNTIVQALEESLPEGEQELGPEEINTIDLVGMIFEFMLKDDELPDSVKSLLSYLHVPYIKVALHDPAMFAEAEHPARLLLNKLSEAGTLWLNKEGHGQFKVFDEMKNVVDKILKDFGEGASLFEDLLDSFTEFVEKVEHRVEQLERLSAQKAEAEQHLQKVKAYVHKRIKSRVNNSEYQVPAPVVALLLYPWFDYLTSLMLRYGEKSEQWQQGLQVIDNLLWSIAPKQTEHEVTRLKNLQDLLRKQLLKGFETIGYEQVKGDDLLEKITVLQEQAMDLSSGETDIVVSEEDKLEIRDMQEQTGAREIVVAPPDPLSMTDDERELVDKLRMIEFGTWFEFESDASEEPQKLKVAWFSKENLSYLFVNAAGKQVSMLTAIEISRQMLNKTARIIAGSAKPFLERALESIYQRMAAKAIDSQPVIA